MDNVMGDTIAMQEVQLQRRMYAEQASTVQQDQAVQLTVMQVITAAIQPMCIQQEMVYVEQASTVQ